jgi:RNA polymerase sigma-70 factor
VQYFVSDFIAENEMCVAASDGFSKDWARLVKTAYGNGFAKHGDLELPFTAFHEGLAHITERCLGRDAPWDGRTEFLSKLHTDDLYLTTACALNSDAAWARFYSLYQKYVNDLLRYLCSARGIAAEPVSDLLMDLFLPDRSGRCRIASYDGRSSLATWLRVIVSHRVINEGQSRRNSLLRTGLCPELADESALERLETSIKAARYEQIIQECLKSACDVLSPQEKLMVLSRFEEGLHLGEIADSFGVHQSTVTRSLERVAKKIREHVVRILAIQYRLDQPAIEECLSVIADNPRPSVSLLALMRQR